MSTLNMEMENNQQGKHEGSTCRTDINIDRDNGRHMQREAVQPGHALSLFC